MDSGARQRLEEGFGEDFSGVRAYWDAKASWLTGVGRASNALYLRSQGQAEGLASYGRMVDLLIADYRARTP